MIEFQTQPSRKEKINLTFWRLSNIINMEMGILCGKTIRQLGKTLSDWQPNAKRGNKIHVALKKIIKPIV